MRYENYPWHAEHAEELNENKRERYTKLRKEGMCVCCGDKPATVNIPGGNGGKTIKYCEECRNRINIGRSNKRLETKLEVLSHYGKNSECKCCWEGCEVSDPDMLSIDHVDNSGNIDRKGVCKGGITFYMKLKRADYPAGFQTLCHNHQWKKEILRRRSDINGKPSWKQ